MSYCNVVHRGEFSMTLLAGFSGRLCQVVGYILPGKSKCGIPTWLSKGRRACVFIFLVVTTSFVLRGSDELLAPRYLHACLLNSRRSGFQMETFSLPEC